MILAVDIGGTKTYAALFPASPQDASWRPSHTARWPSKEFRFELINDFLRTNPSQPIQAAGFSLAGPIVGDQCRLVNLDRTLDLSSVRRELPQTDRIVFANDLVATAHSLSVLPASSFIRLTEHLPPLLTPEFRDNPRRPYPVAVIALGTGLGQSLLISPEQALSSEGAHADFAPGTEQQTRLWRFLKSQFGHVSYERLLSGPGLCNIYSFLAQENPADTATTSISSQAAAPTPPEITSRALNGTCPLCQAALALFIDILGAQAGNLALQTMSLGGVCLAGGIIPHILPALRQKRLRRAFLDKGRFRSVLQPVPIAAVCDDQAALWGAAKMALNICNEQR
ncbi:MAG: glucokinase [Gracilibacteraceae bacterium]|jgi:glucokinase|nr:glucokinase [Gracilibacteraceae bacterium]